MDIDTTKPSISRIYDYVLGGQHNFEVDRLAAEQMVKVFPSYPRWARLNRWFLQMVAEQWAANGYGYIFDIGSGMPTQGHFHMVAPQAKVLYSDIDAMTVAYARDVLGANPSVTYLLADAREPAALLEAAEQHFGGERRIAIGCIGVSYFFDDDSLARLASALHTWAAPGSVMALSFVYGQIVTEENRQAVELFKRNGSQIFPRDQATVARLLAPWQISEIKPLATWLGTESLIQESDRENAGSEMYGVLLEHVG